MGLLDQLFGLQDQQGNPSQFGPADANRQSPLQRLLNQLSQSRANQPGPMQGPPMPPGMMPNLSGAGPQPWPTGGGGAPATPDLQSLIYGGRFGRPGVPQRGSRMPFDIPVDRGGQGGQGGPDIASLLQQIGMQLPQQAPVPTPSPGAPGVTPDWMRRQFAPGPGLSAPNFPQGMPDMHPMAPMMTPEERHQQELDQRFPISPPDPWRAGRPDYYRTRRSVDARTPGLLWDERNRRKRTA